MYVLDFINIRQDISADIRNYWSGGREQGIWIVNNNFQNTETSQNLEDTV